MIRIHCNKADAILKETQTLTAGMTSYPVVELTFSEDWDGLAKTAVVRAGAVEIGIEVVDDTFNVPYECLANSGVNLSIGVYGTDGAEEDVLTIPTVWCSCGEILDGVNIDDIDNPGTATPTLVEQISALATAAHADAEDAKANIIREASATIDANAGTPAVIVTLTDADEGKKISFDFKNLKGEKGDIGGGDVSSVNGILPDDDKNVQLDAGDINVDDSAASPVTVADAIESHSQQIATKADAQQNDDDHAMFMAFMKGNAYIAEEDSTEAYAKTIKSNVIPEANKASVDSIGGHSEKSKNLLDPSTILKGYYDGTGSYSFVSNDAYRSVDINLPSGTYTISVKAGVALRILMDYVDGVIDTSILVDIAAGFKWTRTFTVNEKYKLSLRNQETTDVFTGLEIQIEAGSSATPYVPYGIISASVTDVVSRGRNLFTYSDKSEIVDITVAGTGTRKGIIFNIDAPCVLSSNRNGIDFYQTLNVYKVNGTATDGARISQLYSGGNPGQTYTMSLPNAGDYAITINSDTEVDNLDYALKNVDIQLEYGTQKTEYVPPVGIIGTLTIPPQLLEEHPLHSAGTVYDEYDFERMKFVQRVNLIADLSLLEWSQHSASYPNVKIANIPTGNGVVANEISNYTPTSTWSVARDNSGYLRIFNDTVTVNTGSPDDNPLGYLSYVLATPIETDISSYFSDDLVLPVESGGTVTFEQTDTEFAVPNTISYLRKVVAS